MSDVADLLASVRAQRPRAIGRAITLIEERGRGAEALLAALDHEAVGAAQVLGITGPGGAGKSTLTNQLITRYRAQGRRVGVVAIDPSSPLTGGALLGDRIRMMRHATDPDVVVRSMATRGRIGGLCAAAGAAARIMAYSGCDPVILETVGVGQAEIDIVRLADLTLLVMAPGLGDDIQAMKAGLVELADVLIVNKADSPAAAALATEMEPVAHERGCALCRTCATDGTGVEELCQAIESACARARESGLLARRREANREAEALDWALEILRPQLASLLKEHGPVQGDPRAVAQRVLARLARTLGPAHPPPHRENPYEPEPGSRNLGRADPQARTS